MINQVLFLGQDHGYSALKDSSNHCFTSSVLEGKKLAVASDDTVEVKIGDKYYTITNQGKKLSGINKVKGEIDREIIKVLTLASIYKSSFEQVDDVECNLCVGLPIQYYNQQCEAFEKYIKTACDNQLVSVNGGKEKLINISNITTIPQASGLPFLYEEEFKDIPNSVVIDFGHYTIDVSFYSFMDLEDVNASMPTGTKDIFGKLSRRLNEEFDININEKDMERVLQKGYVKDMDGKVHDLSVLDPLKDNYIYDIITSLKAEYRQIGQADKIYIIGGGAISFKEDIKKYIKNDVVFVDNPRFANANSFQKVAQLSFNV
ncbi:ParM/StbA family protein [Clostridium lacusfryxellense]|uniref:ParM/StbA family protein n=1 Tax=Clostridium lacusfryxellense TaxID=205328 RepID=UPI001C0BE094|nr:ParM/StbA family protein [Clostridium lacusfryxellense]MBU3111603.1 ParM/StbA family protein [Clostridium lacusfryxellense]